MVESKVTKIIFSLVLISLMAVGTIGKPGRTNKQTQDEADENKPGTNQLPDEIDKIEKYSYTLTPDKIDKPDEYPRKEIESFLCAHALGYISGDDLYKSVTTGKYFVKAQQGIENQKKIAESQEINKWFEDQVTVTSKENLTIPDIDTIKEFFREVNWIIGKKKFVYEPGLEAANIVIELAPPDQSLEVHRYIGETSILQDNLMVRLTSSDQDMKLKIETYKLGSGQLINATMLINFTPRELEFRQNNRLVKIYLRNILDPDVRYFTIIHELLHSIGFTGHSPYRESRLFPFPVCYEPDPLLIFLGRSPVLSQQAGRMVEILYRPEILPGMTVKDAAEILTSLKRVDKTPKSEIISYLLARKKRLENRKENIIKKEKEKYSQRMKLCIQLDKLVIKEQGLLEELKEIRADYRLDAKVVEDTRNAASMVTKLIRLRHELILLESLRKRLLEKNPPGNKGKEARKVQKELKRLNEEIVVLKDLLEVEKKIGPMEQAVMDAMSSTGQKQIENELRQILRQLDTIDRELEALK